MGLDAITPAQNLKMAAWGRRARSHPACDSGSVPSLMIARYL